MTTKMITFSGGAIDRAAHHRTDAALMKTMLANPAARTLALWRGRPLVDTGKMSLEWLPLDAPILTDTRGTPVFLGLIDNIPHFSHDISTWSGPVDQPETDMGIRDTIQYQHPALPTQHLFVDLRAVMADLSPKDAGDAATAKSILGWHKSHSFCANCGAPTAPVHGGWQRNCAGCDAKHFPHIEPVVIMLVLHGNDVLLGRSPGWPTGMYSLLAGFMEPGESISEAVIREVAEETAVNVDQVKVIIDQPWPFPNSLMIGCLATAQTRKITIDPIEIEAAQWVSREDVMAAMSGANPDLLPARQGSLARFLLDKWLGDAL